LLQFWKADLSYYYGKPIKQTCLSVATNHKTSDVPDPDSKDRELFNAQNQYFYSILKVKITGG